jgi:hypothetical protein
MNHPDDEGLVPVAVFVIMNMSMRMNDIALMVMNVVVRR